MASLLGRGVILTARLLVDMELDFVVSWRHCFGSDFTGRVAVGVELAGEVLGPDALEKNPKMLLCCLPVDEDCIGVDLAGVRAGALFLPAIFSSTRRSRLSHEIRL
jgi:hypothetical protein